MQPVSIIIPTLNEERYLPSLLHSLRSVSSPLDIIVVDGNSEDGTTRVVEEFQSVFTGDSSLTLIRSTERGISLQKNLGGKQAKHDIIVFCDADVIFSSPRDFEKMISEFAKRGHVVAGPKLTTVEKNLYHTLPYRLLPLIQSVAHLFGKAYFPGFCILTKKEVFNVIGGFDTQIMLAEDIDYTVRAAKEGRFGILPVKVPTSARRIATYGYMWLFAEGPNIMHLLFTGRLKSETVFYPFGAYSGQEAHHVTDNRER